MAPRCDPDRAEVLAFRRWMHEQLQASVAHALAASADGLYQRAPRLPRTLRPGRGFLGWEGDDAGSG